MPKNINLFLSWWLFSIIILRKDHMVSGGDVIDFLMGMTKDTSLWKEDLKENTLLYQLFRLTLNMSKYIDIELIPFGRII